MECVKEALTVIVSTVLLHNILDEKLPQEYLKHLDASVNNPENPTTYLAIDPGKANGVCGYDSKFFLMFMLTVHESAIVMFLHQFKNIKKCVMEGYTVFPNKARDHIYSDLLTPRVIGRVETWAETKGIELIKQPSSIKPTGYKWIGQKPLPKSNPDNHFMDAHVHFTYWGVKNGHINAADLIRKR